MNFCWSQSLFSAKSQNPFRFLGNQGETYCWVDLQKYKKRETISLLAQEVDLILLFVAFAVWPCFTDL